MGQREAGQRDSCVFAAPMLSAFVPTANEVGLTTFEPDAGTTSSTVAQRGSMLCCQCC